MMEVNQDAAAGRTKRNEIRKLIEMPPSHLMHEIYNNVMAQADLLSSGPTWCLKN